MNEKLLSVALGSDHAGFSLKEIIRKRYFLPSPAPSVQWQDLGCFNESPVDYPDVSHLLAEALEKDTTALGVLICGTGIGMSIAVNRYPHIRAALCTSGLMAKLAREHNNANVLILGARIIGETTAFDCLDSFFSTSFAGGRHIARLEKIGSYNKSCL